MVQRLGEALIGCILQSLAADLSFLRLQPGKRWVPYSLIDQLLVAMESNGVGASDAAVRLNEIRTSLVNRVREGATRAAEDSEMLFT